MKTIIASILILSAVAVHAQNPGRATVGAFSGGTVNIAALATNTSNPTIACSEYENVSVQISFKSTGTNDLATSFNFLRSLDSTTYETTAIAPLKIPVTANGTTTVCLVTNLNTYGAAVLKLDNIINANGTSAITNLNIQVRYIQPRVKAQ